jgi:hypothetical protein
MDIAATSTEYVHVGVSATVQGTDVTLASPPKLAFLPASSTDNPQTEEWLTGEWHDHTARLLVGPNGGAVTFDPGRYKVWLSFTAGLETPVYRTGYVNVY